MGKPILVLISTFLFSVMGLLVGIAILWGLPKDYHDHQGVATALMVILPSLGGAVFGLFVGMTAASFWSRPAAGGK
jgi:hypothetical protein